MNDLVKYQAKGEWGPWLQPLLVRIWPLTSSATPCHVHLIWRVESALNLCPVEDPGPNLLLSPPPSDSCSGTPCPRLTLQLVHPLCSSLARKRCRFSCCMCPGSPGAGMCSGDAAGTSGSCSELHPWHPAHPRREGHVIRTQDEQPSKQEGSSWLSAKPCFRKTAHGFSSKPFPGGFFRKLLINLKSD